MPRSVFLALLGLSLLGCPPAGDDDDATAANDDDAADDDDSGDDDDSTPDPCLDAVPGDTELCPAVSCLAIATDRPEAPAGDYWLNGGTDVAALAACEDGWLRLTLAEEDGVFVAENSAGNAWDKCDDDTASRYAWIGHEDDVVPDWSGGNTQLEIDVVYAHPESGAPYTTAQVTALRAPLTELDTTTRLVATTADDDGGTWQDGGGGGHEVYIVRADGEWTLLTPGVNGECGGASGWPTEGSASAFYVWSTDVRYSGLAGDTGHTGPLGALDAGDLLPPTVYLVVATGGGVSVGFEERVFRVR